MNDASLFEQLRNKNFSASKIFFERYYGRMLALCRRYAGNNEEALKTLFDIYDSTLEFLLNNLVEPKESVWPHLKLSLIKQLIKYQKDSGLAFRVSNTVHPKSQFELDFNLFAQSERIELNTVSRDILILAIQQLSPSHRLIYNLCSIDQFSNDEVSELMEYNLDMVLINYEKAKYQLYKNIERILYKPMA